MTLYLGIDPGLTRCGWALMCTAGALPLYLASGVWETPRDEDLWIRGRKLAEAAAETLDELRSFTADGSFGRCAAAVELPAMGPRHGSVHTRHCRGVLAVVLPAEMSDIRDIASTECRKRVLGAAEAGFRKEDFREALPRLIDGVEWSTEWFDESDALALAYSAYDQDIAKAAAKR